MSNNSNYIQTIENVQQKDKNIQTFKITKQQFEENKFLNDTIKNPKYAIGFLYLITHKETGYMYSGSKLSYSIEDAINYCGSSKGKTISDICTKDKILQNGIDQYEFKLIMFCNSCEQMRELEDELNHFNIYYNKLKCLNGKGRILRSRAGISLTQSQRQKLSDVQNNRSDEEKAKIRQKISNGLNSRSSEQKEIASKKMSENRKGEKNSMWGKKHTQDTKQKISNRYNNRTHEQKEAVSKKLSENNGTKTMYQHPYNPDFVGNSKKISFDIKKNWPNKTQWKQFSKEQKEDLKIKGIQK